MNKPNAQNGYLHYPFILLSVLLFIYVFLRANYLSFTHDECLSYLIVKGTFLPDTPNNHLLNNFLMSISYKFFGSKEIFLRFPNVLSFLVYLFFCYLILRRANNLYLIFFGAALLFLNPFLIEFFSLSRGYGLSMACTTACVYFFIRNNIKDYSYKTFFTDFILSATFGNLSVLANLAAINIYIALLSIFAIQYLLLTKYYLRINFKKHIFIIVSFIIACIPIILCIKRLLFIYQIVIKDILHNQGHTSLLDLLQSLINSSFYFFEYPFWVGITIKYIIIISFGIGFVFIIFKNYFFTPSFKILTLISFVLIGFALENYLFSSKYPPERTCTIIIVLIAIYIYQLSVDLYIRFRPKIQIAFLFFLFSVGVTPITINFLSNLNLKYTLTWWYDAHTKEVMENIVKLNMQNPNTQKKFTIGNNWVFQPAINYYIEIKKIHNMEHATRNKLNLNADYIYEFRSNNFNTDNFEKVVEFKEIDAILYKNKSLTAN